MKKERKILCDLQREKSETSYVIYREREKSYVSYRERERNPMWSIERDCSLGSVKNLSNN